MAIASIQGRDARDRIVHLLGLGVPCPLRDLKLTGTDEHTSDTYTVAPGQTKTITFEYSQQDAKYQLCDEDGNPLSAAGDDTAGKSADAQLPLETPKVEKDIVYSIRASHKQGGLSTYLKSDVLIRMGINVRLPVEFVADENQRVDPDGHLITVDFDDRVTVGIKCSQPGISYALVEKGDPRTERSPCENGDEKNIELTSSDAIKEDQSFSIKAFRTTNEKKFSLFAMDLQVQVRPNPQVGVRVSKPVVPYGGSRVLSLEAGSFQTSVKYQYFWRKIKWAEQCREKTLGDAELIEIPIDERLTASVNKPQITDWETHPGFEAGEVFSAEGEATIANLKEDVLIVVRATKSEHGENQEALLLDQAVVILVEPDRSSPVGVVKLATESGQEDFVTPAKTQKGVRYRLVRDGDEGRHDNNRENGDDWGYHFEDRAVDTMRLGIDFVVGDQQDGQLLLPTGPLEQTTTFQVQAEKFYTGVATMLIGKATVNVQGQPK